MRESFSQKVKNQTAAAEIRKKCCRHTCSDLAGDAVPDPERLRDSWEKCRCDGCRTVFFRELFRICGSVTDPKKSYQLDFSLEDPESAAFVRDCLGEAGFSFGSSVRKGRSVLWLRDSGSVEDFLAYLGATSASFDVMNAKIDREFRGNVVGNIIALLVSLGTTVPLVNTFTMNGVSFVGIAACVLGIVIMAWYLRRSMHTFPGTRGDA